MKCMQCGADNPRQARSCRRCGSVLQDGTPPAGQYHENRTIRTADAQTDESYLRSPGEVIEREPDYGETQPFQATRQRRIKSEYPPQGQYGYPPQGQYGYPPQAPPGYRQDGWSQPKRKSRVPYLIVSFLTAAVSVFAFILPFAEWVSCRFTVLGSEVASGSFTLIELVKRFFESGNIVSLISDGDNEYIASLIPESVNSRYASGRLAVLGVALVFIVALFLYLLMILSVLLRSRGAAAAFGIIGSLFYAGGVIGVMVAVRILNEIVIEYDQLSWNLFSVRVLDISYAALGLAALILFLCILFAVLGAGTRKRY